MLFTCYNYYSNRATNTVIFVKDKKIINVYACKDDEDFKGVPLFVIAEDNMKKYPILYRIYIVSLMLTEDPANLTIVEDSYYGIRKKTIWKNLYITHNYDCEDTYMIRYPDMFYNLSTDKQIENNMYNIENVVMIEDYLLSELIEDEILKLENQITSCENYTCKLMYSLYIKEILPDNIPCDLADIILKYI